MIPKNKTPTTHSFRKSKWTVLLVAGLVGTILPSLIKGRASRYSDESDMENDNRLRYRSGDKKPSFLFQDIEWPKVGENQEKFLKKAYFSGLKNGKFNNYISRINFELL
jgi:hypothetical protein